MRGDRPRRFGVPRWSVRSRILASILLVAAVGMLAAGATTFLVQRDRILATIDSRLVMRVEAARFVVTGAAQATGTPGTGTAAAPPFTTTSEAMQAILARVLPSGDESALGIVDGVARYVPGIAVDFHLEGHPAFVRKVIGQVADGQVLLGSVTLDGRDVRYIAVPVQVTGASDSGIYVAAIDRDAEFADLRSAITTYVIVAAAALAAIGIVGWFVAGRLLRPIRHLRIAASRITASDRHERIPVVGRDDVSELTSTVNDMLDRLDGAMTNQRQLLDDVRHELKTPITIVRGHLELLDPTSVDDVVATRALAIDELDRMAGLVDDIESLAESRLLRPTRFAIDVAEITAEVYAKATVITGHDWVVAEVAHVVAAIDPARITQAWLQLVDNSAKYSPPGSRIALGSSERGKAVEFWVSDAGPGIPEESRSRIVERFGRVDSGRGIRGSGLGLAIVKSIAVAHGGWLGLQSSPAGSRFSIVVPRDPLAPIVPEEGEAL